MLAAAAEHNETNVRVSMLLAMMAESKAIDAEIDVILPPALRAIVMDYCRAPSAITAAAAAIDAARRWNLRAECAFRMVCYTTRFEDAPKDLVAKSDCDVCNTHRCAAGWRKS